MLVIPTSANTLQLHGYIGQNFKWIAVVACYWSWRMHLLHFLPTCCIKCRFAMCPCLIFANILKFATILHMASLIISYFALLWLTYALILKVQLLPMCMLCTRHPVTLIGFVQTLLSNLSILCNTSINQQPIVLYPLSWNANSLQAFPCTIRNDNATLEVVTKLGDKMVWNSTAQPPGVSYIKHVSKNATPSNILCAHTVAL